MTRNEKAVTMLEENGITAHIENDTVYVTVEDCQLELAEFEIEFQASRWDEMKK
jgi:hypothetical protein